MWGLVRCPAPSFGRTPTQHQHQHQPAGAALVWSLSWSRPGSLPLATGLLLPASGSAPGSGDGCSSGDGEAPVMANTRNQVAIRPRDIRPRSHRRLARRWSDQESPSGAGRNRAREFQPSCRYRFFRFSPARLHGLGMRPIRHPPLTPAHRDYAVVKRLESALLKEAGGLEKLKQELPALIRAAIDEVIDAP
ncbi:MAG: hypothetical protein USCAAHI_01691 [Beijerinckiaceae bacterium]|nr:MAG: hypothetical protein USCAAHI_01691 [Beijerinckiaceae bacterium]